MAQKRTFKTKKKLTGGRCSYRAWREWKVGDYIIGEYTGQKTDNYDKPNWLIKVEDAGGPSAKTLKKLIGQTLGLNSAGQLDKAMKNLEEGECVQVMYNGTSEIEGGKYKGKDAHVIEVDLVVPEGEDDDEDTDDEEYEDDDSDSDDEDEDEDDL